jgi:hypothetical protein
MKTKKIVLFFVLIGLCAAAVSAQTEADFTFNAATGTITKYSGFDTAVVIPATIGGKPVKVIGGKAFQKAELASVTIPDVITIIGNEAFADNKLTSVTIPGSVTAIGDYAFARNQLTSVIVPEGVIEIGGGAFENNNLASISFPSTIRTLGYTLYVKAPATVVLAANINIANRSAFGTAVFYNYIANDRQAGTYTSDMLFAEKRADNFNYYETQYGAVIEGYRGDATRLRIPAELGGKPVKALGFGREGVFRNNRIDAIQLPDSLTYIGPRAFANQDLASVTLPAGLTYIGDSAFELNSLAAITIPEGVTYIGTKAFWHNGIAGSLTIPGKVTYIGVEAFQGNNLTAVTIPGSVKIVETHAFRENQLTSLTIKQGVAYIMQGAFYDNKLTSLTIEQGVTFIGVNAFFGNQLTTVTIPASVKRMDSAPADTFILQGNLETEIKYDKNGVSSIDVNPPGSNGKAGRYTWNRGRSWWDYSAR